MGKLSPPHSLLWSPGFHVHNETTAGHLVPQGVFDPTGHRYDDTIKVQIVEDSCSLVE